MASVFTPVYSGRSDGITEIRTTKHGKEANGPSADQLDKVANPNDYYELLDHDHSAAIEWKRILGGMIQREMRVQSESPWFLLFFPENYRLYKHNKQTRDHTGESLKCHFSKTQSNDKKPDAFLYGYPQGRKKRYRSAQEFFPHLLWLMEGKSEDYGDCPCKYCAGEWVHKVEPLPGRDGFIPAKKEILGYRKDVNQLRKESTAMKSVVIPVKREIAPPEPKVVVKQRPSFQDKIPKPPTKTAPAPTPAPASGPPPLSRAPPQPSMMPTPLPIAQTEEQAQDAKLGGYFYRIGEIVWFSRGTAWGLAVIIRRDMFKDQHNRDRPRYLVQPLSHPFHHPDPKIVSTEQELRPWLAWSAPGATHTFLTSGNHTYNSIDWKIVMEGRYGAGDVEVDGSIFAAKSIDDSFTLMNPIANNTTTTGERSYSALYLGGEKIYVGEPVRLRINQGHEIMVVQQIIEKLKPNSTNIALATTFIIGDVYRFTSVPYPPKQPIPTNPHLPACLTQDLEFRNRFTITAKRHISYWQIVQPLARLGVEIIKGRWYDSGSLLPVLHGAANFAAEAQRGEISDVGNWINGRGDANQKPGTVGTRYKDRKEALGRAVPPDMTLSKGLDGPKEDSIVASPVVSRPAVPPATPDQDVAMVDAVPTTSSVAVDRTQVPKGNDGDIAEFMNLDRME